MINRIFLNNFRNLDNQTVELGAPIAILTGANGAGKTSFLEAVYTVLNGKSFRSSQTDNIVSLGCSDRSFLIRAEIVRTRNEAITLAIKKSSTEKYIAKIDSDLVESISQLALVCPTQIVEPKSFNLLDGGAGKRRRFLDWGVFHVEHNFSHAWKHYLSCLKQRNALLKTSRLDSSLLKSWDQQLALYGATIANDRAHCFSLFKEELGAVLEDLLPHHVVGKLEFSLYQGWSTELGLLDALTKSGSKDIKTKTTNVGPHRADVKIKYQGLPAVEGLSRGQQKLLALAFQLAYVGLVAKKSNASPLLLLDDVCSELDDVNSGKLFRFLSDHQVNVIATAVDPEGIKRVLTGTNLVDKARMFHVEHGKISTLEY